MTLPVPPSTIFTTPLRVQLAFYAFALTLPTSALKTFSWLSDVPLPTSFYVIGGVLSVVIFCLFFSFMWSVLHWPEQRT